MNSTFVISDSVFRALGWALVHSLWQGAVLAVLLLAILPRLHTAKRRYQAAYGTLMAVLATAAGTFCWMFEPDGAQEIIANDAPSFGSIFSFYTSSASERGFWSAATDWLEDHHVLIVLIWLLGFVFFLFRLGAGLWQVHKLQTQFLQPVADSWQIKIDALGTRLGVNKAIRLFESALVRSPVAIGWLKPVILLPIGLINRLSIAEVEAILAHELAHIARRDWIFNLLQAFVEAIFYYHPAVWWVSAIVRRERENCCDDAALAATGNPLVFAKALVQVQELAAPAPMLALGIGGSSRRRPLLLERIRRILNQPQQKSQVMEKLTATAILLALLTIIGLRANTPPTVAAALSQITDWPGTFWAPDNNEQTIATDTVPKPKSVQKITREDDNGKVEMEMKDGEITRLNVDGKEISPDQYDLYQKLAAELQNSVAPAPPMPPMPAVAPMPPMPPMPNPHVAPMIETTTDVAGNVVIKLQKDGKPVEIKVKDGDVWMDGKKLEKGEAIQIPGFDYIDLANMNFNFDHQFDFSGFGENSAPAMAFSFSDEDKKHWAEDAARIQEEVAKHADEYREIARNQRELSEDERRTLDKELKELHERQAENQDRWREDQQRWQADQEKWRAESQNLSRDMRRGDSFQIAMKSELLRDKLITDLDDYSFELSDKNLKVNGKKQTQEIHRKYLDMYERITGKKMEKGNSYNIEIHN